jgi:hypothetical protein
LERMITLMENLSLTGRTKHDTPDELQSLSVIQIDGDEIFIDNGAIHGKSRLERGVDFRSFMKPEDVPNARRIPEVWVTLRRTENGMGYFGVCAAEIWVNDQQQGYKSMAQLVNSMDGAMKGKVDVKSLTPEQREKVVAYLQQFRGDLWTNTPEEVKAALA